MDYIEIFCLIIKASTVSTVLNLAVMKGWVIRQVDVNNAFLNGFLEDLYMTQPEDFINSSKPHSDVCSSPAPYICHLCVKSIIE